MKLLLVDDEVVALRALKRRVDWLKYGFEEVFTAQDAAGAREVLAANRIDLALLDIEMPGESGTELAAFLHETYPQTEITMVTCHADFDHMKKSIFLFHDVSLKQSR